MNQILAIVGQDTGQFRIPEFQRYYRWEREDWEVFWKDILSAVQAPAGAQPHFLGSVVAEKRHEDDLEVYRLIDGQQRLTTCMLLLSQLAAAALPFDEPLQREIRATLYREGDVPDGRRPVLVPKEQDLSPFLAALWVPGHVPNADSRISEACAFFSEKLANRFADANKVRRFFNRLRERLAFVVIVIDGEPRSFVYRVFQDLNTKGKDLSPVDVIRNYVLMNTEGSPAHQDARALWNQIESICNKAVAQDNQAGDGDGAGAPPTAVRDGVVLLEDAFYDWTAVRHGDAFNAQSMLARLFEDEVRRSRVAQDPEGLEHLRVLRQVASCIYACAALRRPNTALLLVDGERLALADEYDGLGYAQGGQARRNRLPQTADPLHMQILSALDISYGPGDEGVVRADAATRARVRDALRAVECWYWRRMFAFGSGRVRRGNRPFLELANGLQRPPAEGEESAVNERLTALMAQLQGGDAWPTPEQIRHGIAQANLDWNRSAAQEAMRYLEARLADVLVVPGNAQIVTLPPSDLAAGSKPPLARFVLLAKAAAEGLDVQDEAAALAAFAASQYRTTRLGEPDEEAPAFGSLAAYFEARANFLANRVSGLWS